jgi:YD repeat-containing protein
MAKKISTALFALLLLQCVFSLRASAQVVCEQPFIWYWPDALPQGTSCIGPAQGPFSMICIGLTANCPPVKPAFCPTCNSNGAGAPVGQAGAPINLATGNTYIEQNDVRVPGLGGGLNLVRTWSSTWPSDQSGSQIGLFGSNWRSTYEERVFSSGNYMVYSRGDGSFWFFSQNGSTWTLSAPASVTATLALSGSTWTLTFKNGEQRTFDYTSGFLTGIIDRNGNTTTITWNVSRLTTVTDPASRSLTFTYGNSSYPNQITGVTSSVGLSVSYSYDTQGRLSVVTENDGSTLTFAYDANSLISSVTDAQGKVIESHTYDAKGRGLTSARANGVEAVTVSYPNE